VLDDHLRWRRPLVEAAAWLRALGGVSLALIAAATAAMVMLAAQAALAANRGVIRTLRLIGATDHFIAGAFVQRFAWRAALGALAGTLVGMGFVALLPQASATSAFSGLGFSGFGWLAPLLVPPIAALVAYGATRYAAFRTLRETT
jgi:cell division transport system permease protein